MAAAVLAADVSPASAQNTLFDVLFGRQVRQPVWRGNYPPPPRYRVEKRRKKTTAPGEERRAPAPKISAPSYYNYKPSPLVAVDFSAIRSVTQAASLQPPLAQTEFRRAVSGLEGFELLAEKDVAEAVKAHYATSPDFIWVSNGEANDRARDVLRVLGNADSHGLLSTEYAVSAPSGKAQDESGEERLGELMRFEMTLSARVLRYVRDAYRGRIDPNRLSGYHDFPEKPLDLAALLKDLSSRPDVAALLESYHPKGAEYRALRVELEALRASMDDEIVVDAKLLLKPGQSSPELPKLLQIISRGADREMKIRFGEVLSKSAGSETYSQDLVPVIEAAQAKAGLKADGIIGPRTVEAIAGVSKEDRIGKVLIALEQLRWHPSDLGATRVFINQPAFTASYIEDGVEKLSMRTVVGQKSNQTSFFYDEIEQVDYNPYWGVPQSIIVNEMLPRLINDPGYLDRAGYEVTDSKGKRIPSSAINWGAYGSRIPFSVRQTPSEANALGELKILFPNKHAIYMHDTPQKELFKRDTRAFSHGCVRLQDPRGMAAAVLGKPVDHVAEKLKKGHSTEKVTRKIPVYVAYFTAWPDASGKVQYFGDIYDRDARLMEAIEKTDDLRAPSS